MKKEIVTMLLAAALMTSSLTACTNVEAAGNDIDNTTTETTIENTTPAVTTLTQNVEPSPTKYELTLGAQTFHFDTTPQETFENFISEKIGYTFVFDDLLTFIGLFKTEDGGTTWNQQNVNERPALDDWVICAKMIDENVGCIFVRYWADDCISKRTYITADGGQTWKQVMLPANSAFGEFYDGQVHISAEAYDFFQKDGKYIICFRIKEYDESGYIYYQHFQYSSSDLIKWNFVE